MANLNLLPDGGRSATRIPAPKGIGLPKVGKPKPLPIFRQPDGGLYPGGQYPRIKVSVPKKKPVSVSVSQPKLNVPKYSSSAGNTGNVGMISLPGTGGTSSNIADIYRRTQGQLKQMAKEAVLLEVNPQLNALAQAGRQENTSYDYLINQLRKQLGLSKGDVKGLYDTLDVSLAVNAQKQQAINTDTKNKTGAIYDQLKTDLGANYDRASQSTKDELARLHIVDPKGTQQIDADKQFLQGQATTQKANQGALMDAINASTQGVMQGMRAGSAATSAMLQSGLQQQFDKTSADALQSHLAKIGEINMQRNTLKNSIPSKINQTYAALLDQQYQREMDAAQKLFDNQIKLGNFSLAQQNAQTTANYRQNQLALEATRIADARKKAATPAAKPLVGVDKALSYLQSVAAKSKIPYSQLQNLFIDAINGGDGPDYPGFNKNYMSRYGNDLYGATKSRGYPQLYPDMIRAMQYYFGG